MPYTSNDVTPEPTQFHVNYVAVQQHVTSLGQSETSEQRPAPTSTNHDSGPSHAGEDVTATRANGVSASCSRSSSRSSGFDEISSAVTEWSLLPVSVAHAHADHQAEVMLTKMADGDEEGPEAGIESRAPESVEEKDAENQDTTIIAVPEISERHDKTVRDEIPESSSSQAAEDKMGDDHRMEELSRQIESMSERFNQLFARVKAAESSELRRSTVSLSESVSVVSSTDENSDAFGSSTLESKYSRNAAYRRWLNAKAGSVLRYADEDRTRQPITAADDPVAMATERAPADRAPLIGRHWDQEVAVDDVTKSEVTSEVFGETNHLIKSPILEGEGDACNELEATLNRESPSENVTLKWSPDVTGYAVGEPDYTSHNPTQSDRTSRSPPRQISPHHQDQVTTTPTRPERRHLVSPTLSQGPSRRLLPVTPAQPHARLSSSKSSDVFYDDDVMGTGFSARTSRLSPAASFESVQRMLPTRRRSAHVVHRFRI